MATLNLSEVLVPELFFPYMVERTAAKSALVQSGIMQRTPEFDKIINSSGSVKEGGVVAMPFWQDLSDVDQTLNGSLTTNQINSSNDAAAKQGRGQGYSAEQLLNFLIDIGEEGDPTAVVAGLIGEYWARRDQAWLISILKGVFGAASMSGSLHAIFTEDGANADDANKLTDQTYLDALQLMGDRKDRLTAVAMHSVTETALAKQQLIDYIVDEATQTKLPYMFGRRVIVDDTLPTRAGTTSGTVYRTYLFGEGAIAWGERDLSSEPIIGGTPGSSYGIEYARTAASAVSDVFFRRILIMHPRGVKYNMSSQASTFPTQAELETAANWTRVWETKNVRIVAIDHNN